MSISIVTITYNSSSKIQKLLRSINNQDYSDNIELIIIDNNSTDKEKIKKRISKFRKISKFRIVDKYRSKNLGFSVSCNYGVKLTNYPNILFLNPDVELMPNSLSTLRSHANRENADICGGKSIKIDSIDIHRTVYNIPTIRTMVFEFSNLGKITGISGNFYNNQKHLNEDRFVGGVGGTYLLIKKSVFIKLGGFDKKMFMYLEDVDLCNRAGKLGFKIVYCPHSKIKHVGGSSSTNKYKINQRAWNNSRKYYAKKHFSTITSNILLALYKVEEILLAYRERINSI
jgi:GT2 family glycosyltransferase